MPIDLKEKLKTLDDLASVLTQEEKNASLASAEADELKKARGQERTNINAAVGEVTRQVERLNKDLETRQQRWLGLTASYASHKDSADQALAAPPLRDEDFDALRGRVNDALGNGVLAAADFELLADEIKKYDDTTDKLALKTDGLAIKPDAAPDVVAARKDLDDARAGLDEAVAALSKYERELEGIGARVKTLQTEATSGFKEADAAIAKGDNLLALRRYLEARKAREDLAEIEAIADKAPNRAPLIEAVTKGLDEWVKKLGEYVKKYNDVTEAFARANARARARGEELDKLLANKVAELKNPPNPPNP